MKAYALDIDNENIIEIDLSTCTNPDQLEIALDEKYIFWSYDRLDVELELNIIKQLSLYEVRNLLCQK